MPSLVVSLLVGAENPPHERERERERVFQKNIFAEEVSNFVCSDLKCHVILSVRALVNPSPGWQIIRVSGKQEHFSTIDLS